MSLLILFFVSIPLFSPNVNELNKKTVIGMNPSVPLEFDHDQRFWWLVRGKNELRFQNSSDERIKGDIVLIFEPNPCNLNENVLITHFLTFKKFVISGQSESTFIIPIEINHKSSTSIFIEFLDNRPCLVSNGDVRDFGAKLVRWSFE